MRSWKRRNSVYLLAGVFGASQPVLRLRDAQRNAIAPTVPG